MKKEIVWNRQFTDVKMGTSLFNGERVKVHGEQLVRLEDGTEVEQYLYDIVGFDPMNGKAFVAHKRNIVLDENKER